MLAIIRIGGPWRFSLWLPLFLIWLLLLPFALLALPIVLLATLLVGLAPFRVLGASYALLCSTRGTHVEIASPDHSVFVHVY